MRNVFFGLLPLAACFPFLLPACGGDDAPTCSQDLAQARDILDSSYPGGGCVTDADCTVDYDLPECMRSTTCGGSVVAASGASAFTSAIAAANAGPCAAYDRSSCSPPGGGLGCPFAPGLDAPQCIEDQCVAGYEASWTSFSVQMETSSTLVVSPDQCSDGCTEWTVTPDGQIEVISPTAGQSKTVAMASDDFAILDDSLRDPFFRQTLLEWAGLPGYPESVCAGSDGGTSSPDGMITMVSVRRPVSRDLYVDATGCSATPSTFAAMYTVLQKY